MFGTPEQVVARLRECQAAGVDQFCYGASFGLPHDMALRSLELFITEAEGLWWYDPDLKF